MKNDRRPKTCAALASALLLAASIVLDARADDAAYLTDDALASTLAGATLIAKRWAEYYTPDGEIVGRVRYLGLLHDFRGRWRVRDGHVCFEYDRKEYNTCSKLRLVGDRMFHFDSTGKPKNDGESRRLSGNRLDEFR